MYHGYQSHSMITKPFLQSSASEKNHFLLSNQQNVLGRLKENMKMIEMINSSRFEIPKEKSKDLRLSVESEGNERKKKELMGEMMSKLDFALNDSESERNKSRIFYHETENMEDKIKEFENRLKQVKEVNTNSHEKLNRIKDQTRHSSLITFYRPEAQYKSYKYQKPHTTNPSTILGFHSRIKANYEFQKYIKPERRIKYRNGCIEPDCRGICQCYERLK